LAESLSDLKISCAGFASPYTEQLNREGAEFLAQCGLDIVEIAYVGKDLGNYGQGDLQPQEVYDLGLRADHSDAEAIVLSCTDMRALEVVDRLESELDKPVVTSNQALMYIAAKRLGLDSRVPGKLGTLSSVTVDN
jgi:maleate cis-trans isomerase